jgi:hypothetical protein
MNYRLLFIAIMATTPYTHPIQRQTFCFGSTAMGLCSVAASYYTWITAEKRINPVFLAVISGIVTATVSYELYCMTPGKRIDIAYNRINELTHNNLIKNSFSSDDQFFDALQDIYLSDDLPLISAYNHLISALPTIHEALSLINKASTEKNKTIALDKRCQVAQVYAQNILKNISYAIKNIREHKDYLRQLQIYKEFLTSEKQALAQTQMAAAHMQIAQAQSSSTLLKWLKAIFWGI